MVNKGIFSWHLIVWPVLTWLIASGICYWLDKLDIAVERVRRPGTWQWSAHTITGNPLEWSPLAWWITAAAILYIVGVWIIYQHAQRYNRNTVRWTTAAIVFSPILAWIAYGLSWRKI